MIIRRATKKYKQNRKINRKRPSLGFILKKVFFWLIFVSFCGVTGWTVFFSDVMRVTKVDVSSSRAEKSEIVKIVEKELNGTYFSIFPKNNLLLIPKNDIREKIKKDFVFVRKVDILRSFPKTINVTVEERESHIVWCSINTCHLVDERAEAFYKLDHQSNEENDLVSITDQSNKEVFLGSRVASPSFVKFCEYVPEKISSIVKVNASKKLTTPSSMSSEVRIRINDKWELYLSTDRPIEIQAEVLKKIMEEKIEPEKVDDIEYIDLRIKGKATFKLKGEEESDSEDEEVEKLQEDSENE